MRSLSVKRIYRGFLALGLLAAPFLAADVSSAADLFTSSAQPSGSNFSDATTDALSEVESSAASYSSAFLSADADSLYPVVRNDEGEEFYVVSAEELYATSAEEDAFLRRRSSGFLAACLGDDVVYRGQTAPTNIIPPAESSTAPAITTTQVSGATSGVPTPPVIGSGKTFSPEPNTPANGEPTTLQKLLKYGNEASASYMYIPKGNTMGLGFNELEARVGFAIPCQTMQSLNNTNNGYFLLTPKFTYDNIFLSKDFDAGREGHMNLFDAGLTSTFLMNYNDLEAFVDFSFGVSSSFKRVSCKSFYFRGRAEVGLPIDTTRHVRIFGGVEYLDTLKYKLVPIVGLKYVSDDQQNQLRLAFPNPRWDHYLTKVNETDWWLFVHGDITSHRWFTKDPDVVINGKHKFNFDYDDYKVGIGLTFDCPTRLRGSFEIGGAFGRDMRTKLGSFYKPKDQVYLKVGLAY